MEKRVPSCLLPSKIWKDIPGFDRLYRISTDGDIISLNYKRLGITKPLKTYLSNCGYLKVILHKHGKYYVKTIHSLVMLTFVGPPEPSKPHINHIDENKTNNSLWNLEYCDRKYNRNYGTTNERLSEKFSKPVLQFSLDGMFIREWKSLAEIKKSLKVSPSRISTCCNGKGKTAYGYVWKYKQP